MPLLVFISSGRVEVADLQPKNKEVYYFKNTYDFCLLHSIVSFGSIEKI